MHLDAAPRPAPAHVRRVEHHVAHRFGTAGDDEIIVAARHLHARLDHRLQTGAAAAIDLHARHRHRQPRVQGDHPPDRGCLHARVAVPDDHVLAPTRVRSRCARAALQRGHPEIDGGQRLEHAVVAPDRRANGFTDDGLAHHRCRPPVTSMTVPVM